MRVIACYSINTPYEEEAKILSASLRRVGMPHEITGFVSNGDWYDNTAYKARFIRDMRHQMKGPLLYVDVDAFFHENCEDYFNSLAGSSVRLIDLGVHYFNGPAGGHDRSQVNPNGEGTRLLSGTLYLGDTMPCRELLQMWCSMNAVLRDGGCKEGGGQKNLWYLTTCMGPRLKIHRLPGRYCYVFDKPWAYHTTEPRIIEHTIASRDNRSGVHKSTDARRRRKMELRSILGEV